MDGQQLRDLRNSAGLTLDGLAAGLGHDRMTIWRWEQSYKPLAEHVEKRVRQVVAKALKLKSKPQPPSPRRKATAGKLAGRKSRRSYSSED